MIVGRVKKRKEITYLALKMQISSPTHCRRSSRLSLSYVYGWWWPFVIWLWWPFMMAVVRAGSDCQNFVINKSVQGLKLSCDLVDFFFDTLQIIVQVSLSSTTPNLILCWYVLYFFVTIIAHIHQLSTRKKRSLYMTTPAWRCHHEY